MDNVIHLPLPEPLGLTLDEDRIQQTGQLGAIPEGLVEWIAGTEELNSADHGLAIADIARVEAFWCFVDIGFSCAGFVLVAHDGTRFHFQSAIDEDNQPDLVAVTVEELAAGQLRPEFGNDAEPDRKVAAK